MHAHHIGQGSGLASPKAAPNGGAADAASMVADPAAHAALTVQKESVPAALAAPIREQIRTTCAGANKVLFTLRALLALNGHVLNCTRGDDGTARFYVTRWSLVRELAAIAAVRAFAEQVGAAHA